MSQINRIVNVQISRQTQQISIAAFDIPLILVRVDEDAISMPNRVETFTSLDGVKDLFGIDHAAYKISQKLLSGDTKPVEWRIGKAAFSSDIIAGTEQGFFGTGLEGDLDYEITVEPVNGAVNIFPSRDEWLYTGDPTFTGDDTFTVVVTNDLGDEETLVIEVSVATSQLDETYAEALVECVGSSVPWYGLLSEAKFDQDILAMAAIIQAEDRMYFTSSSDINMTSQDSTTDIGYNLEKAGMTNTVMMYSPYANEYPEATWVGTQLVKVPGSNTWAFKQLNGSKVYTLTDSQIFALEAKNVNYYTEVKGAPITRTGTTSEGEWIDTIIFVHWTKARIQENIFGLFVNRDKVPMTRAGATMIESRIRSVLDLGVRNGGIADDTPYVVIAPDPLALTEQQRGSRVLGDFFFEARLAGAVHATIVRGTVTY